jgi:L-ascorbate metabolism protein UlaG (beta-lactamase superfamily)
MGPEGAVYACKLIRAKYVIPMHFSTFPVLTGTPEAFQELMKEVPGTTVILLKPGESTLSLQFFYIFSIFNLIFSINTCIITGNIGEGD